MPRTDCRRAHHRIRRCRINAAFRGLLERCIYAAERGAKRNLPRPREFNIPLKDIGRQFGELGAFALLQLDVGGD
jgi:hypothetical protein